MNPLTPHAHEAQIKQYTLIAYILYLASLLMGITLFAGVIVAYVKKNEAVGTIYHDHLRYLIRTFWLLCLGTFIGFVLLIVLIGYLILIAVWLWFIYRMIVGFIKFNDNKPINPDSWF